MLFHEVDVWLGAILPPPVEGAPFVGLDLAELASEETLDDPSCLGLAPHIDALRLRYFGHDVARRDRLLSRTGGTALVTDTERVDGSPRDTAQTGCDLHSVDGDSHARDVRARDRELRALYACIDRAGTAREHCDRRGRLAPFVAHVEVAHLAVLRHLLFAEGPLRVAIERNRIECTG